MHSYISNLKVVEPIKKLLTSRCSHNIQGENKFDESRIIIIIIIGGSRGGVRDARPPPGRPNSFDFMQFSGKFGVFTPPLEGSRPPLGKILDPPLIIIIYFSLARSNTKTIALAMPLMFISRDGKPVRQSLSADSSSTTNIN